MHINTEIKIIPTTFMYFNLLVIYLLPNTCYLLTAATHCPTTPEPAIEIGVFQFKTVRNLLLLLIFRLALFKFVGSGWNAWQRKTFINSIDSVNFSPKCAYLEWLNERIRVNRANSKGKRMIGYEYDWLERLWCRIETFDTR